MAEYATEDQVRQRYHVITGLLIEKKITVATMESCTAGFVASLLTDREGASAVFLGGSVTYCNREKLRQGVPAQILENHGVYSAQTAAAMAVACREQIGADIGIGITGTFGNPDTNNADSCPGKVFFALDWKGEVTHRELYIGPLLDRFSYKLAVADAVAVTLLENL